MRILKISYIKICILIVLIDLFSACQNRDKTLNIYGCMPMDEMPIYVAPFEKEQGVKVEIVRLSAGEAYARIKAESNNPQATIWYGGPINEFISAAKEGLLQAYNSPEGEKLDPKFKDPQGLWYGIYFGAIGFACNTEFFKSRNLEFPSSWQDLLSPKLKKEIAVAYPYSSGTAYIILATLVQLMGENKAFEYMKELDKNILNYNRSGSAAANQAGRGEVAVGICFAQDILRASSKGYKCEFVAPIEGTGYEIGGVALLKNAPNPELGKKFIDYALSTKHQDLYAQSNTFRVALNPQAKIPENYISPDKVKLVNFDFQWASENKERLVNRWKEEIKR